MNDTNFVDSKIVKNAILDSFIKLSPKELIKSPVIFVTAVGAVLTTVCTVVNFSSFNLQITIWLWFTVLFANFSEALAEGKGKAQAEGLKKSKTNLRAKIFNRTTRIEKIIDANDLKRGDIVICHAQDVIPADGDVIEGVASVDESAITGESAPVIRESGGDRSAVTGGTTVKSDWIVIQITSEKGESFVDRMILLIEGAKRQKTPNEKALDLVLYGLTFILFLVVFSLKFFGEYSARLAGQDLSNELSLPILISLFVCLIPTTIGGLLSAIGISGMNRLVSRNVMAKSGRAVEAAGDISVLMLDKTGTITLGNRMADQFFPAPGIELRRLAFASYVSSLADETAEGRSIIEKAKNIININFEFEDRASVVFVPFMAQTRISGVDFKERGEIISIRKGAVDAILKLAQQKGIFVHKEVVEATDKIAKQGGTPLLVCNDKEILGSIYLKDIVKPGIRERFLELRQMGIKTVMITGDNILTATSIAAEAGVDDFIAEATPETKLAKIRQEQANGHLVAMTGDGTNDAPALAQADVGVAMNMGTQAAREAGNMVDLDSDPTKLIEIVQIGKDLLITRGALTTFSFANDLAKYFAILPAMFGILYAQALKQNHGPLEYFNIMHLTSPQSAILSAVIFNALIIVMLAPLALRGVGSKVSTPSKILLRNVLVYGVGGVIAPFIGIKIIDLFLTVFKLI